MANNQPVVFNVRYTPYKETDGRAFFDMSGDKNIFKYITTKKKRIGEFTMYDYLQKNTGVFNQNGMLPQEEIDVMKERLKHNKGNIWHGYMSFNEHESKKIDSPDKCIHLVKRVFPTFFKEAGFKPDNVDLMCALHLDRPTHLHIHFVFWEKEPLINGKDGEKCYRRKGRISGQAIDRIKVRASLFADGDDKLYKARDEAIGVLRKDTNVSVAMHSKKEIRQAILELCKELPKEGRLAYGSENMKPFREKIDKIVNMLLEYDTMAKAADMKFYSELSATRNKVQNICGMPKSMLLMNIHDKDKEDEPKYNFTIDEKTVKIVEDIESDYKRRQGNLVVNLCKFIKPEYFERDPNREYKSNDNNLKRKIAISRSNVSRRINKFFSTLGGEFFNLERDFSHRLQDIEKEIEHEREKERKRAQALNYKGASSKSE